MDDPAVFAGKRWSARLKAALAELGGRLSLSTGVRLPSLDDAALCDDLTPLAHTIQSLANEVKAVDGSGTGGGRPMIEELERKAVGSPEILASLDAMAAAMSANAAMFEANGAGFKPVDNLIGSTDARDQLPMQPTKRKATRRERQFKWLAEAMLTVRDHPEWSDATIAEQVRINKSRLSRSPEYQTAATMARTSKAPGGFVMVTKGDRTVEAVDDSFDLNRSASRQSEDEEDVDERIDREMNQRKKKRNN